MRYEVHVFKYSFNGKCRGPNYYEGKFKRLWTAYLMARFMAWMCDLNTPRHIIVKDAIMTRDGYRDEVQENPVGIRWGIIDRKFHDEDDFA